MACMISRPVLPITCAGWASPAWPPPASKRWRTACNSSFHWVAVSSAVMSTSPTIRVNLLAHAIIVATIKTMKQASVTSASEGELKALLKTQGCTNLRLRQLMRRVARHYDLEIAKAGLKGTQYSLLSHVLKLGPLRPGDLARGMQINASTLTRNLKPLVDA